MYQYIHSNAEADLKPIISATDAGRFAFLDLSTISNLSWFGVPERKSVNTVLDAVQAIGRPILVSCSSINAAAYATLKRFSRDGIPIDVIPNDASGREQAISIAKEPKFDFAVCADAPLFLDQHDNVRIYSKIFEIYRETQFVLRKRGPAKSGSPRAHVYEASSAKQQFLLDRGQKDKSPLPAALIEVPLIDMADFALAPQIMRPGDLLFAWGALARSLITNPSLVKLRGSEFELTVSMFCHPRWSSRTGVLNAFLDVFAAEWNFCESHPDVAFGSLVPDLPFLDSFARGGGFKTKFRNDPDRQAKANAEHVTEHDRSRPWPAPAAPPPSFLALEIPPP